MRCGHFAAAKYISSQMVGITAAPLTEVRDEKAGGLTGIRFTPSLPLSQVPNREEFKPGKYIRMMTLGKIQMLLSNVMTKLW